MNKEKIKYWMIQYAKALTIFSSLYILLVMWIGGFVCGAWSVVFDIGITWMAGGLIFLLIYFCINRVIKKE